MPPSRELDFILDHDVKGRLERHLRCGEYRIKFTHEPNGRTYGTHDRLARLIVINLGMTDFTHSRPLHIQNKIIETLLHEYRHAYQHANWPATKVSKDDRRSYQTSEMEEDAREWSAKNVRLWRTLGRLSAKTPSKLGRLSRAEQKARAA